MKLLLLVISLALNVWLATSVVRLENIRYGLLVGVCSEEEHTSLQNSIERPRYLECLQRTEARTSPLFHLAYALGIL